MEYNIKMTGMELTPELQRYLDRRLSRSDKFVSRDPAARADIELEFEAGVNDAKYRAEFNIFCEQHTLRAEARGATIHEAIDIAADELFRELARLKGKRKRLIRRGAAKLKDFLRWGRSGE